MLVDQSWRIVLRCIFSKPLKNLGLLNWLSLTYMDRCTESPDHMQKTNISQKNVDSLIAPQNLYWLKMTMLIANEHCHLSEVYKTNRNPLSFSATHPGRPYSFANLNSWRSLVNKNQRVYMIQWDDTMPCNTNSIFLLHFRSSTITLQKNTHLLVGGLTPPPCVL